jgi:hypothetical protein
MMPCVGSHQGATTDPPSTPTDYVAMLDRGDWKLLVDGADVDAEARQRQTP